MSSGPGDQINIDRDYDADRGSAWRWLLPLLALAIVAALLWAMFGTRGATYPTTTGNGTTISTPVGGASTGGTTGSGMTGSGVTGTSGTSGTTGGAGTTGSSGTSAGTTGSSGGSTSGTSPGGTTGGASAGSYSKP